MEVLTKKRSFLVKLSLMVLLSTSIHMNASFRPLESIKHSLHLIKIGAATTLGVFGYMVASKVSKRPILSMAATVVTSVYVAHKLSSARLGKKIDVLGKKIETNRDLIETVKKTIRNLWGFIGKSFNETDKKIGNLKTELQELKGITLDTNKHVKSLVK